MGMLSRILLVGGVVLFLVGAAGNLMELAGGNAVILWPPLAWWRASIFAVALAMALSLDRIAHHPSGR